MVAAQRHAGTVPGEGPHLQARQGSWRISTKPPEGNPRGWPIDGRWGCGHLVALAAGSSGPERPAWRRRRRRHGEGRHRRLGERVGGWSAWPQGRHVRLAGHLRPCEVCGERTGPRIAATVTPTSTATRPVREWDEESGSGAALGEPPRLGFSDGDDTPPAVGRPAAARRSRSRRRPPSRRTARCIPGRRLPEVQLHAGVAQRPWHRRADSRDDRASRRAHQERRHRGD